MVTVEVVYMPLGKDPFQIILRLEQGSTVENALAKAKIEAIYPEIKDLAVGIYSKKISRDTVLKEGDRIEFYRPLTLDPKEKRRLLAQKRMRRDLHP